MKKWLVLGGVVLAAVVIGAIAVANLEAYLNENKSWFEEQAAASVGRPVAFDRVGVGLWPGLAIDVENLRIADDPAYSQGNLLEIDEIRVRVDLWSAVFGDLDVSGIALERPVLSVVQTRDGLNLETLGAADAKDADAAAESSAAPLAAVIAFLEIGQGEIRYIDRTSDPQTEVRIQQLEFEAEDVGLKRPIRFSLAASVLADGTAQNVRLDGTAGPIAVDFPLQTPIDVRLTGNWTVDDRLAQLANLASLGAEIVGDVALSGKVSGTAERLELDFALDGTGAAVRYEDSFDKAPGTPFEFTCAGILQGNALDIAKGAVVIADARIEYAGRLDVDSLSYGLTVTSPPIDLARREALLPGLADLGLSGRVALDLKVTGSGASEALPKLSGEIALSDIEVRVPEQPAVTGLTGSVQLRDGGAYMDATPLELADAAGEVSLQVPDIGEPVANVQLASRAGRYSGVDYESLDVAIEHTVATSVTKIDRMRLAAYGGELSATGSYDAGDPTAPALALNAGITALRLEKLLAAHFDPASRVLEGKLGTQLRIQGVGADWEALKSTLTGAGSVSLDDGALRELNLGGDLLSGLSGVPGLQLQISPRLEAQYPAVFGQAVTQFENLRGQLRVQDGKVLAENLRLAAADYVVTASGSVSLDADVDLRASFSASKALSQSLVEEAKALRYLQDSNGRIEIPFWMRGGVDALQVEPDMQYLAQRVAPALVGDLIGMLGGKKEPKDAGQADQPGQEDPAETAPVPASGDSAAKPPEGEVDPAAAAAAVLRELLRGR